MKVLSLSFVAGLLFGLGLVVSGMTDPSRVVGFLDLAGEWDPALVFVMGGALVTYSFLMWITRRLRGGKGLEGAPLPCADSGPINARLLLGSAAFGIGWALAGFCPGPALANLSALRADAFVFVPAMLIGMIMAHRIFDADR